MASILSRSQCVDNTRCKCMLNDGSENAYRRKNVLLRALYPLLRLWITEHKRISTNSSEKITYALQPSDTPNTIQSTTSESNASHIMNSDIQTMFWLVFWVKHHCSTVCVYGKFSLGIWSSHGLQIDKPNCLNSELTLFRCYLPSWIQLFVVAWFHESRFGFRKIWP